MKKLLTTVVLSLLVTLSFLAGRRIMPPQTATNSSVRRVLYYVDPMHPEYKSTEPGIAPDCGMALEPVYATPTAARVVGPSTGSQNRAGTATINLGMQRFTDIRTVAVEKASGTSHLRVLGRVAVDDNRVYRVNAGVDGWLRETYDASVGSHVNKDEKLGAFYSPELVAQQNSYLVASDRLTVPVKEASLGIHNAADRLRNLGMSDRQIKEFGELRRMPEKIYIVSPTDGFIVARSAAIGQRFEKGMDFYRIADLSSVWIIADVPANVAQHFQTGAMALVTVAGTGKELRARVANVLPYGDQNSRTMKVRFEAANPGVVLRPDMLVDVDLPTSNPAGIMVPEEAVLDSGQRQQVFVYIGEGLFEEREVKAGKHFDSRIEILKGLKPGDRIAASGNFLIDSESRLKDSDSSDPAPFNVNASSINPFIHKAKLSIERRARNLDATKDVVKDPNCGMDIPRAKAVRADNTLLIQGSTVYFCSKRCKEGYRRKAALEGDSVAGVPAHD
jgi:Cu(I)/Ag(I) efflux system membrane fusion protein